MLEVNKSLSRGDVFCFVFQLFTSCFVSVDGWMDDGKIVRQKTEQKRKIGVQRDGGAAHDVLAMVLTTWYVFAVRFGLRLET